MKENGGSVSRRLTYFNWVILSPGDSDGEIDDRKRGAENKPKCVQKRRTKIGQAEAERKIVETVYHIFTTYDLLETAETAD